MIVTYEMLRKWMDKLLRESKCEEDRLCLECEEIIPEGEVCYCRRY